MSFGFLDSLIATCKSAGRIDLAIATQQRLIKRCRIKHMSQATLDAQNKRLKRLMKLKANAAEMKSK